MRNCITTAFLAVPGALSIASASADDTTGNRYGYPVLYHSEISSAKACLDVNSERHHDFDDSAAATLMTTVRIGKNRSYWMCAA